MTEETTSSENSQSLFWHLLGKSISIRYFDKVFKIHSSIYFRLYYYTRLSTFQKANAIFLWNGSQFKIENSQNSLVKIYYLQEMKDIIKTLCHKENNTIYKLSESTKSRSQLS